MTGGNFDTDVIAEADVSSEMFSFGDFGRASAAGRDPAARDRPGHAFNIRRFRAQEAIR